MNSQRLQVQAIHEAQRRGMFSCMTEASISHLASTVASIQIDRASLPQHRLDIRERYRTSFFAWRGQFSPELVDLLLASHATDESVVLDPFVGSGTTLFEATRRGLTCYGAEINPAALHLAGTARFACLDQPARARVFERADRLLDEYIGPYLTTGLFDARKRQRAGRSLASSLRRLLLIASRHDLLYDLFTITVIQAMRQDGMLDPETFARVYRRNRSILAKLPLTQKPCHVFASDARQIPLDDKVIDLIVTSPPYINVFNYHQYYRRALEFLGWDLLEIAPSEIGANRKHRGNRFLTVIQYCIDMLQVLREMRRLLKPHGTIVITIGRESKVRGVSFRNGDILAMLAIGGAGLRLSMRQERCFKNRFGTSIYEDLLTLKVEDSQPKEPEQFGRLVGVWALKAALETAPERVRPDLVQAIQSRQVKASPIFACRKSEPGAF